MSATISEASQSARLDRLQTDGPIAAPGGTGHPEDVELHVAAKRMAGKRVAHPVPDLHEGRRGPCKQRLKIHRASLPNPPAGAASTFGERSRPDCWDRMVNDGLSRGTGSLRKIGS
jgi:hypothetical protein